LTGITAPSGRIVTVEFITDAGLREIGELPDPQVQLTQRFDAAIEAIQRDRSIPEVEKKPKIDWLEEGKIVARTLTIDAIKAILIGTAL
jgi:hypothetical protein